MQKINNNSKSYWARLGRDIWKHRRGYLFVLPSFIFFSLFYLIPMVSALVVSFFDYTPLSVSYEGLANYRRVFNDPIMFSALRNNAIYTAGVVTFWLGKALLIAFLIDPLSKTLKVFFKSAFYLPGVTSGVIISLIWLWMYNPSFGLFNNILNAVGLPVLHWLGNTSLALPALILMQVVMGGGSSIILIAAAMGRIPNSIYESAILDGASRLKIFYKITMPLIKPVLLYLIVMGTINTFKVFDAIYVMTGGGPQFSTTTIVFRIYETAFTNFRMGEAAAQSMILFSIVFLIAIVQFRWLSTEVEY